MVERLSAAEKESVFEFVTVTWLEKHLRRFVSLTPDVSVAREVLYLCNCFLVEHGFEEAMRPLYPYFSIALSLLSTLPSSKDLIEMAENAAHCLMNCSWESEIAAALVLSQTGALASMAFIAASSSSVCFKVENVQALARHSMRVVCAPPAFDDHNFPFLLDSAYSLPGLCGVTYEPQDAARLLNICTTPTALHFMTSPLPCHRVCVAASLAHLATLDERFVRHFADKKHLETLLYAVFEAATATDDAAATLPGGCTREWHTNALLTAVVKAARACHISAPAEEVEEEETRRKRPRFELDVSDVGVQHRDSTTFLIAARPFYAFSHVLEKVSPVLKQAMEAAGDAREPIALPLAIDAPSDRHHALFGLAVEFAYTGAISRLSDDDALPLYTLAEFLQINALRSYVLDTRLKRIMHADLAFAERVWTASMTFPGLQEGAAAAVVAHLSRPDASEDDARLLLRRCHDASAAQPSPAPASECEPQVPFCVSLLAQTMRSALRARLPAVGAGAVAGGGAA